jgi:O-acetyl-ADP-ribose deacetylase (regulator of RNase III)
MKKMNAKKVNVIQGDITQVASDALIKSISHCGWATSNLDIAIKQQFGDHFHKQVEEATSLKEGMTVVAHGTGNTDDSFAAIVFVVDDATMPLSLIVCNALSAANRQGFKNVTLPALRTGILFSKKREQTLQEALAEIANQLADGVKAFLCQKSDIKGQKSGIESITFVIKNDPSFEALLTEALDRKAKESEAEMRVWHGQSD